MTWGLTRDEKQANLNTQQQMRTVWQAQNLNAAEKQMAMQQLQQKMYPERWLSKEESEPSKEELFKEEVLWDADKRPWVRNDGVWQIARGHVDPKPEQDKSKPDAAAMAKAYVESWNLPNFDSEGAKIPPSEDQRRQFMDGFAALFGQPTVSEQQRAFERGAQKESKAKPAPNFKELAEQAKQAGYKVVGGMVGPDGYPVVEINGEMVQVTPPE